MVEPKFEHPRLHQLWSVACRHEGSSFAGDDIFLQAQRNHSGPCSAWKGSPFHCAMDHWIGSVAIEAVTGYVGAAIEKGVVNHVTPEVVDTVVERGAQTMETGEAVVVVDPTFETFADIHTLRAVACRLKSRIGQRRGVAFDRLEFEVAYFALETVMKHGARLTRPAAVAAEMLVFVADNPEGASTVSSNAGAAAAG